MNWVVRARALLRSENGQVFVFAALGMIVFLSLIAFAVDLGMYLHERTKLQAIADASALAAAQELPSHTAVDSVAIAFSVKNHPGVAQVVIPGDVTVGEVH